MVENKKGFIIFPKSEEDIHQEEVKEIWNIIKDYCKLYDKEIGNPLALSYEKTNKVKIQRWLNNPTFKDYVKKYNIHLKDLGLSKYKNIFLLFGEGSRGKTGVYCGGFSFENNLQKDLNKFKELKKIDESYFYPIITNNIVNSLNLNSEDFKIVNNSTINTKRKLIFGDFVELDVENSNEKVADLTINCKDINHHLSLKYGVKVALFNTGFNKFLKKEDIKSGKIENEFALRFLDVFDINPNLFCRVFNEYEKTNFLEYHQTFKPTEKLLRFLKSSFGINYYVAHINKNINDFYFVDDDYINKSCLPTSEIKLCYGGVKGNSKSVDVIFSTLLYKFRLQIRSSKGIVYPDKMIGYYTPLKSL